MTSAPDLYSRHRELLEQALVAIRKRDYFSAYPESPSPKVYGEDAAAQGVAAFEGWRAQTFPLPTPSADGVVASES